MTSDRDSTRAGRLQQLWAIFQAHSTTGKARGGTAESGKMSLDQLGQALYSMHFFESIKASGSAEPADQLLQRVFTLMTPNGETSVSWGEFRRVLMAVLKPAGAHTTRERSASLKKIEGPNPASDTHHARPSPAPRPEPAVNAGNGGNTGTLARGPRARAASVTANIGPPTPTPGIALASPARRERTNTVPSPNTTPQAPRGYSQAPSFTEVATQNSQASNETNATTVHGYSNSYTNPPAPMVPSAYAAMQAPVSAVLQYMNQHGRLRMVKRPNEGSEHFRASSIKKRPSDPNHLQSLMERTPFNTKSIQRAIENHLQQQSKALAGSPSHDQQGSPTHRLELRTEHPDMSDLSVKGVSKSPLAREQLIEVVEADLGLTERTPSEPNREYSPTISPKSAFPVPTPNLQKWPSPTSPVEILECIDSNQSQEATDTNQTNAATHSPSTPTPQPNGAPTVPSSPPIGPPLVFPMDTPAPLPKRQNIPGQCTTNTDPAPPTSPPSVRPLPIPVFAGVSPQRMHSAAHYPYTIAAAAAQAAGSSSVGGVSPGRAGNASIRGVPYQQNARHTGSVYPYDHLGSFSNVGDTSATPTYPIGQSPAQDCVRAFSTNLGYPTGPMHHTGTFPANSTVSTDSSMGVFEGVRNCYTPPKPTRINAHSPSCPSSLRRSSFHNYNFGVRQVDSDTATRILQQQASYSPALGVHMMNAASAALRSVIEEPTRPSLGGSPDVPRPFHALLQNAKIPAPSPHYLHPHHIHPEYNMGYTPTGQIPRLRAQTNFPDVVSTANYNGGRLTPPKNGYPMHYPSMVEGSSRAVLGAGWQAPAGRTTSTPPRRGYQPSTSPRREDSVPAPSSISPAHSPIKRVKHLIYEDAHRAIKGVGASGWSKVLMC